LNRVFQLIFILLSCGSLSAQVSNNNIKDRTALVLNATPAHSNTNHSSVEWSCINKALTNKCLVYHNDQWFHFTPDLPGKFFLNVSSQQCRDLRGIQVIVIEGNPCEVSTYKILQCIPKIHQDDVFIELDSLKAGVQYLVNVDGFLGDFCSFDIQFSTMPQGLPRVMNNLDSLSMTASLKDSVVSIAWSAHESIADEIKLFRIYRTEKEEKKSILVKEMPLRANALGDYEKEYKIRDSLVRHGSYTYRIFGIQKETMYPLLLDEHQISFYSRGSNTSHAGSKWVYLPMNLKNGERYLVLVFNKIDYSLLRKYTGEFDAAKDATFEINLQEFVSAGVKEFIILASEATSNQSKEFYFRYDGRTIVGN
jgi:hypothetical protein